MSEKNTVVNVHENEREEPVAKIMLNGYNIDAGNSFSHVGAMRSFKIITGQEALMQYWQTQVPLQIDDGLGNRPKIRIYAAPRESGGLGFVEFL